MAEQKYQSYKRKKLPPFLQEWEATNRQRKVAEAYLGADAQGPNDPFNPAPANYEKVAEAAYPQSFDGFTRTGFKNSLDALNFNPTKLPLEVNRENKIKSELTGKRYYPWALEDDPKLQKELQQEVRNIAEEIAFSEKPNVLQTIGAPRSPREAFANLLGKNGPLQNLQPQQPQVPNMATPTINPQDVQIDFTRPSPPALSSTPRELAPTREEAMQQLSARGVNIFQTPDGVTTGTRENPPANAILDPNKWSGGTSGLQQPQQAPSQPPQGGLTTIGGAPLQGYLEGKGGAGATQLDPQGRMIDPNSARTEYEANVAKMNEQAFGGESDFGRAVSDRERRGTGEMSMAEATRMAGGDRDRARQMIELQRQGRDPMTGQPQQQPADNRTPEQVEADQLRNQLMRKRIELMNQPEATPYQKRIGEFSRMLESGEIEPEEYDEAVRRAKNKALGIQEEKKSGTSALKSILGGEGESTADTQNAGSTPATSTVQLVHPNGTTYNVPQDQVEEAIAAGYTRK